jgi:class 3 adenylate cyclase
VDRHEERRLVACLFIDVVGSTELTIRLGPERLKAALGAAFNSLRLLIEDEGGTVEKYIGDEIYALFGAPVAHEDDPARAIRAADAARRWASAQRDSRVPFDVRVGIETGEAVIDLDASAGSRQQMSVGAVVNIASRLCHQAEPGQVLVGPVAHSATEELAAFHALGPVDLKGVGPTDVWALAEVKSEAPRRRLPFVGRDGELELLRVAQRRARSRSVLALVSGPPGQGKTRLTEEFIGSLGDARVLAARCRPGGEISALAPLQDILLGADHERSVDEIVDEAVDEPGERPRVRDALVHSVGIGVSDALASLGKDERDDEIQNAWHRLVRGLAVRRPLVLWVEDVHWAAPDVMRLLDRLSLSGVPFLLLVTARPEFAEAAGLRPSGDRFFIELEGLELPAARALATSAGGADETTIARAEGNPLFIVELARTREPAGQLPLTLQGALGARLDELETEDRSLLAHAAVVGETFAPADAAALTYQEPRAVGRALARLADRHYLDPVDGRYRFHHSLLRDVVYGRLLVADRMRLHARYARERASAEDPEVLAHHWWAALGGPDAEWVWRDDPEHAAMRREAYAAHLAAGRRSAELFALERAVPLFERAFEFAADDRERGEAKRALADAYAHDLHGDDAWRAYMDARMHFVSAGRGVPPEVYLGALKIRLRVGAFNQLPQQAEVDTVYAEGEAAARASGDAAVLARTLVYGAFTDMDPATLAGDRGKILEAMRLSEHTDARTRREILGWYAGDLLREFELDRAVAVLDQIDALPVEANELDRMEHLRGRAVLAYRRGDLAALEDASDKLVTMSRRMGPHLRTHADAYAAQAALARADWTSVVRLAVETERTMRSSPGTAFCSSAGVVLAYGAAAQARAGHADEARALAQRIRSTTAEAQGIRDLTAFALVFTGAPIEEELLVGPTGAVTALAARMHKRALLIADELEAQAQGGARFWAALSMAIREEVARDRGGPPPRHAALRAIGYLGWSELAGARI